MSIRARTTTVRHPSSAACHRRTAPGDVPMLCILTAREEFPLLLNKMNLNGPWAELGVFEGQFSAHLLRHGNTSKLHLVDMWTEVTVEVCSPHVPHTHCPTRTWPNGSLNTNTHSPRSIFTMRHLRTKT